MVTGVGQRGTHLVGGRGAQRAGAQAFRGLDEVDLEKACEIQAFDTKKPLKDDPGAVAAADPSTYADSSDPAFVILHGSDDRLVSPSQTLTLYNTLRAKGVDSTRYVLKGANHGDLSFMGGDPKAGLKWSTQEVMGDIVTAPRRLT
ncbi:prolyl oligopeptidase family serine peptidase [Streptomyces pseudovenezuelae]|uniref:Acetyl esterase/lipase n=1 Tax=Streptomyces pseudovenezuelae TaxID=67350 RepID=A0ABT6LA29_9ACTN|nr:prolyl oligopeptidase family serine peptidase [Streptomyces pseudovenezuelae]MDH6212845.1 acetyl esterase/lipase [Streptomyces pseudovenezuelae]